MFEVNDIPPIDGWDLQALITENTRHEEFLFSASTREMRTTISVRTVTQNDTSVLHGVSGTVYRAVCGRSGQQVGNVPALRRESDTQTMGGKRSCGGAAQSIIRVSLFQVGAHGELWLTSCQVRMNPYFLDSKYIANEYCRYVFSAAGAKKWSWQYDGWALRKSCSFRHWYDMGGCRREDFWVLPSEQELAASTLRYSQLNEAFAVLHDLIGYLALYCKYPAVEYLWKMGFGSWLRERENGGGCYFRRLVNLRATEPKKLFPGLGKADIKLLRETGTAVAPAAVYKTLRLAGAARPDMGSLLFAKAAASSTIDLRDTAVRCGVTIAELRKYIERQSRKSGLTLTAVMHELQDYHRQLAEMTPNGNRLPYDLHEAHARLSERARRLVNRGKNEKFRTRRRLLAWTKWKWNGMFIRPIDSADEIIREGEEQNNCVASYADRHANGKTAIMVLRRCSEPRKAWHTVEIDLRTLECIQCYGYDNRVRTPEAAAFMEKYLDHLREVTKMVKRRSA